jgi:hypothetical protein
MYFQRDEGLAGFPQGRCWRKHDQLGPEAISSTSALISREKPPPQLNGHSFYRADDGVAFSHPSKVLVDNVCVAFGS